MYGQVIPKIYSANKRLIFSETLCFSPNDGVVIKMPTSDNQPENGLTFNFHFVDDKSNENASSYKTENTTNTSLKFTLVNFGGTFGTGTTTPIGLSIGDTSYSIFLYAHRLVDQSNPDKKLLHMTITMYGEAK